jgi:hypothetical protein
VKTGQTRTYDLAADELTWDYAPGGVQAVDLEGAGLRYSVCRIPSGAASWREQ